MASTTYNNGNSAAQSEIYKVVSEYLKDNYISSLMELGIEIPNESKLSPIASKFAERTAKFVAEKVSLTYMQNRLQLIFEYEKHYLSLIKEFKEEIKFANSLQEDLRKERANFFSATLKEVYATLQATKVGPEMEMVWLKNLVESYTESLDLSSELAKENTLAGVSHLKDDSKAIKHIIED